ncbi:MAG: phosphomethylpyrimidine synthase ThiC, partial [bacterium]
MTQLEQAKKGIITEQMHQAASYDKHVTAEYIAEELAEGRLVIPYNVNRKFSALAIGHGLTTKVNANIGTSGKHANIEEELVKMNAALK